MDLIKAHYPLLVTGVSNPSSAYEVKAPYDGQVIATIDCVDEGIIEEVIKKAYQVYRDRSQWLPLHQRIGILEKAIVELSDRKEMLALEAAREGGKPLMDSLVEADRLIDSFKTCVQIMRTEQGRVIPMQYNASSAHKIAFTQKEPIGVVLAISAFNHPLNLIAHQVGSAVAAGCPIIIKPSTDTPLSCWRIVKILHEAGLPKEWLQMVVIKENEIAEKLATDKRLGFFSFIGSAKVGWHLRSVLAPGVRCALEHGGVAPAIVAKDAVLDTAIPSLVEGAFYHAGQVCVSVKRIYVEEEIAQLFTEQLAENARKLRIGDPTLKETEIGPLIHPNEIKRIETWVNDALEKGARLICGGKKVSDTCYEATVLFNPAQDAILSQNEAFAPVVCIYPYHNIDEAIDQANALPFAFQAAIYTQNLDTALRAYSRLDASAVMVNESTAFRVDGMPFTGLRQSGLGVGGIEYSIHDMQIDKMMVIKSQEI